MSLRITAETDVGECFWAWPRWWKLKFYGIRDDTLLWAQHWLTDCTQRVVVDGDSSTEAPVQPGVPQGTVLGPIMFLLYINIIGANISSVADDCTGWFVMGWEVGAGWREEGVEIDKDLSFNQHVNHLQSTGDTWYTMAESQKLHRKHQRTRI